MSAAAPMPPDQALRLLGDVGFGQVALHVHALPLIVPVRLSSQGRLVTAELRGVGDFDAALDRAVVALQANGWDDDTRPWSVHVIGRVIEQSGDTFVIDPSMIEGCWLRF